jgi:5'-methylthioadenosine phosphorylase
MGYVLGVIGGSGLYQMPGLAAVEEVRADTPWGAPSDAIVRGTLGDTTLLFLPRHGRRHAIPPHAINFRANLFALRALGATHVVSVSAVGSLREEIAPGDLVVVDQFIDRTTRRASTYFDEGLAAHVSMADPVCPILAGALVTAAGTTPARVHPRGTYVCIEGPRFGTRAESFLYRGWNADVVGMTNVPECFLARELELPYATLALATDYDCWRTSDATHDVAEIVATLRQNVAHAQAALRALVDRLPDPARSPATGALRHAVMTDVATLAPDVRARYEPILGRYWPSRPVS